MLFNDEVDMERDPLDAAIDEVLAAADGDVRRALRAVLVENVQLESELRHLYAVSHHGKPSEGSNSLH
jgi:hypothetical protein